MKNKSLKFLLIATLFLAGTYQTFGAVCGTADLGGVSLGFGNTDCLRATSGSAAWRQMLDANGFDLPGGSIIGIIQNLLFWLLAIFSLLGIIAFVYSGLLYLTAYGDGKQMENAKNNAKWGVIGLIVGLSGIIIITAVNAFLSGSKNF